MIHGSNCQSPRAQRCWRSRGDLVVGGKLLEELDIGDESRPRKDSFKQVMTQEGVLRDPSSEGRLERVDIVDPFAGVGTLPEKILINVGDGGGVRVDASRAREDPLEKRPSRSVGKVGVTRGCSRP